MTAEREPWLETERLLLRRWREDDREPFAALNADPRVMEHFPRTLTRELSDRAINRQEENFERRGFAFWAAEVKESGVLAGWIGLAVPDFESHFTPCVEIGWRLAFEEWGKGYATEGARAALRFGFTRLDLEELVAFTTTTNIRSQAVMLRLGMTHNPADDFNHPRLEEGHRLQRHVLYRIRRTGEPGNR